MDIVAFYQDATQNAAEEDSVWKKFGGAKGAAGASTPSSDSRPGTAGEGVSDDGLARATSSQGATHGEGGKKLYEKPVSIVVFVYAPSA